MELTNINQIAMSMKVPGLARLKGEFLEEDTKLAFMMESSRTFSISHKEVKWGLVFISFTTYVSLRVRCFCCHGTGWGSRQFSFGGGMFCSCGSICTPRLMRWSRGMNEPWRCGGCGEVCMNAGVILHSAWLIHINFVGGRKETQHLGWSLEYMTG